MRVTKELALTFTALALSAGTSFALDGASVAGIYHVIDQTYNLKSGSVGTYGMAGSLTFDANGGCSYNFTGTDLMVSTQGNAAISPTTYPKTGACNYTIGTDGKVAATMSGSTNTQEIWTSVDGMVSMYGGTDTNSPNNATNHVTQGITVKAGSGMSNASFTGIYHMVSQDFALYTPPNNTGAELQIGAFNGTVTADGQGGCTATMDGYDYSVYLPAPQNSVFTSKNANSSSCTYSVAADGAATFSVNGHSHPIWLSADSNVFILGGPGNDYSDSGNSNFGTSQLVGVKQGSGMTVASLKGTYKYAEQDAEIWGGASGNAGSLTFYGATGTITFDGKGGFTINGSGTGYSLNLYDNNLTSEPETNDQKCTYSISPDGTVNATCASGSSTQLYLSADGNVFITGGALQKQNQGNLGYTTKQFIGIRTEGTAAVDTTFAVTASVIGGNGAITCDTPVNKGASSTCTITPDSGYHLASLTDNTVNKLSSVKNNSYTITNVTADHSISGSFEKAGSTTITKVGTEQIAATSRGAKGTVSFTFSGNGTSEQIAAMITSNEWIKITAVKVKDNGGTFAYAVSPNTDASRSGKISVGELAIAVNQEAVPCKIASIGTTPSVASATGEDVTITVSVTPQFCSWGVTAIKAGGEWVNGLGSTTITGNGKITGHVSANNTGKPRSTVVTVATTDNKSKKTITIKQGK